jgi:hypothetical protein
MIGHAEQFRLGRALGRMTVDAVADQRRHDRLISEVSAFDMTQQIQLRIKGKIARTPVTHEVEVTFPYPFLMKVAQAQTEGPVGRPHFASGVEMDSDHHINVEAHVRRWVENDSQFITGATIRVMSVAPYAEKLTPYSAIIHLSFSGYASPTEVDTEG